MTPPVLEVQDGQERAEDALPGMVPRAGGGASADDARAPAPPIEQEVAVPAELVAEFTHGVLEDGRRDSFNDLGRGLPRDDTNRVSTNGELLARVNAYSYELPAESWCRGLCLSLASLGTYYTSKRRTVPPGFFGHYLSMGRHMLKPPGRHVLMSTEERWLEDIRIDDETELIREVGIKTIVVVPENHLAGAFRVAGEDSEAGPAPEEGEAKVGCSRDGDFVLLGQGRHVLDCSRYREIVISKLDSDTVTVGPLTVLYVREGFLAGAYERTQGTYQIFPPGPPILLHEKDYEFVELVEKKLDGFRLGPVHFVTVKDGEMAGAYHKASGRYQLLPPNATYKLHEKDFANITKMLRTDFFSLGPYTFINVPSGMLAGTFRQSGGQFQLLAPGHTYLLNENEYRDTQRVMRDRHSVKCGPITYLTAKEGCLMGAYRTSDGAFEELELESGGGLHFELHEAEYHGITVVPKYRKQAQRFGPKTIITIPEGECGVFLREGALEIREAGFYKVDAQYTILENIPLHMNSESFPRLAFMTSDSVRMSLSAQVLWRVSDPLLTAKWPGSIRALRRELRSKATSRIVTFMRGLSRGELLPTNQDALPGAPAHGDGRAAAGIAAAAAQDRCLELLSAAAHEGGWGLEVVKVSIDSLELDDDQISADMQAIAQSQLSMKRVQMEGRAELANADIEKEAALQRSLAKAEVREVLVESSAKVQIHEAQMHSEISLMEATNAAKAAAEAKKIELQMQLEMESSQAALDEAKATRAARADAEAKKIELETNMLIAQSEVAIQETRMRAKAMAAETMAASTKVLAEAHYDRGRKEQEVAAMKAPQEFELRKLEFVVQGLKHFAKAAWRHPEDAQRAHLHLFWEEMKPFIQVNPINAAEMQRLQHRVVAKSRAAQETGAQADACEGRRAVEEAC